MKWIYSKTTLLQLHRQIDTPALLIDQGQMFRNIESMQQLANSYNVNLRPHIKTHKSVFIARKQLQSGAAGITVAKLSEAEVMMASGCKDIFIANQLTHPLKLQRLQELHHKVDISVGLDHMTQVKLYGKYFFDHKKPLQILIEIDSGLQRCGVLVGEHLLELAKKIIDKPGLYLKGIFTHAGQVYSSKNKKEVRAIGQIEGQVMNHACNLLKEQGIEIETVSVGSTPTVPISIKNKCVTEIRPGNYVFYDNIQISLASCKLKQCSLYILATIISQPTADRIVIDAGSKAINLDRGAHAVNLISGYGRLLNLSGEITRLSEEHGIIKLSRPTSKMLGEPVLILPNHACAVANLYTHYHLVKESGHIRKIELDARGKSQ